MTLSTRFQEVLTSIIKRPWQDLALLLILITLLFLNYSLVSQLQQLPSPLYGGDYYNHLGSMEHIYQGGSIFQSGQLPGEIPWVPFLYHILVIIFAIIMQISLIPAVIYFSLIIIIASSIINYNLFSELFEDKTYGLLAVIWNAVNFPVFKYSHFSFTVILPLFIYASFLYMKEKSWKRALFMGATYGLAGLSNTHAFIWSTFFLGIFFCYQIFVLESGPFEVKNIINALKKPFTIFFTGFSIALIWWWKPVFVYHGKTLNDMQSYGFMRMETFGDMITWITTAIKETFFVFSTTTASIQSILLLLGLCCVILNRKTLRDQFTFILLASSALGLVSHFITMPILGTHLAPSMIFNTGIRTIMPLLFFIPFKRYSSLLKHYNIYNLLLDSLFIFFILILITHARSIENDQWIQEGKKALPENFIAVRDWTLANTQLDDVFISANELGFAFNALTGRKLVTNRRTHSSPYADMNQRMLDAAIVLYGNNDTVRDALIEKYQIKYIYWNNFWLQSQFVFDDSGNPNGISDSFTVDYTAEREKELQENNISYKRLTFYLDPAWIENFQKRDILLILPPRWDALQPWNQQLDRYLDKKATFTVNEYMSDTIYSIKIPDDYGGK